MRAGQMRHKISIESRSTAQTTSGEQSHTWRELAQAWASVEPLDGREFSSAQQLGAKTPTRFKTRYVSGVFPKDRIVWDDRVFDIIAVRVPGGIQAGLDILTDELVGVSA